ncbi:MAG: rod shape-determining protein RodA [Proteobacteria bacterium]|nr:rod shape-determining protein RodA [Pseudomonadota bacterium]
MIDRRLVQNFDWKLLGLTLILSLVGAMTLYSAVTSGKSTIHDVLFYKQIIWYTVGIVLMIFSFLFNYKAIDRWAFIIYGFCVLLLLLVLFFGKYAGGSRRWLIIGPITFQPSEFAKLAVIFVLARYYSKTASTNGLCLSELIVPVILCMIPFVLIVLQPDLGTAMLILLIAASMSLFVKIEKKAFVFIIASISVAIPTIWFFLRDYQKKRIITFLNPEHDPLGAGYHIIQSKIAIGSGMISGKGFLKGTQSALSFLPEQQTDFIFSVFAEEWGFIGCLILLLVFFMFIARCLKISYGSRNPFGAILSFGITAMILWHIVVNMGMAMGLMPVVGVTLPFISYGGSSIIIILTSIGIMLNISMRRFLFD